MPQEQGEIIVGRFASTVRYMSHLEELLRIGDWHLEFERFQRGELTNEAALALVHPAHLAESPHADHVRGPRSFVERTSAEWAQCQSVTVWGYECPISSDRFEADHLFPYKAGGPTTAENRIWLCPEHNRVKSSDVHLFPWETRLPSWTSERLSFMAAHIGSSSI